MSYLKARHEFMGMLMDKFNFPQDAKADFNDALAAILSDKTASEAFAELLNLYDNDRDTDFAALLDGAKEIGEKIGIHEYAIHTVLLLCMGKRLLEYYRERNLSDELCFGILADIGYKLNECRMVKGINGTFVGGWYRHIFGMKIFALGRLQIEIFNTKYEYTFKGRFYPIGSRVINIHIPRTGTPLVHEQVLESYRMAEQMFANEFEDGPLLFLCDSWLLDPWIPTVLKAGSNLTEFHNDFEIVKTGECYDYSALWTVFDQPVTEDISLLPDDTSLRRAYIERIRKNEPFYYGHGMFFYKNGEILK